MSSDFKTLIVSFHHSHVVKQLQLTKTLYSFMSLLILPGIIL